jgi:hypothetical protein
MSREIQIVLPDPRGDQPNDYPPPEGYGFTKTWPPGAPPGVQASEYGAATGSTPRARDGPR